MRVTIGSFTFAQLNELSSQIDKVLKDVRLCEPYSLSLDFSSPSISGVFVDPFSGTEIFKHWED